MNADFASAATKTVQSAGTMFAYREVGSTLAPPLVFLNHLTGVLDDWDPAVIDGLAKHHRVIIFDNRGVGGSAGTTPDSIEEMALDAAAFIDTLGLTEVDLLGFSMGGFVAQLIAHDRPELVRRLVLAGTGPAGGEGIAGIRTVAHQAIKQSRLDHRHPKHILFFAQTPDGQRAADAFLRRLTERQLDRDCVVTAKAVEAHLAAVTRWGSDGGLGRPLAAIRQPVLVANGDNDIMVPTSNSIALFRGLPNAQLSIFPSAGHGGIFQYHSEFVAQALQFFSRAA